jgi:hypothetical protein
MAATFPIGSTVKVKTVPPEGPVKQLRFNEVGEVECLVSWTDVDGASQERWFPESFLVAA